MEITEYSIAGLDAFSALKYSEFDIKKLSKLIPEIDNFEDSIIMQLHIEGRYQGYLKKQEQDILAYKKDQALKIPVDLDYDKVGGLNLELRAKLNATKPATLASASRISGITPAGLTCLLKYVKKS